MNYDAQWRQSKIPSRDIAKLRSSGESDRHLLLALNELIAVKGEATLDSIPPTAKMIRIQEEKFGRGNFLKNSPYN